jgi:hypothetical protein
MFEASCLRALLPLVEMAVRAQEQRASVRVAKPLGRQPFKPNRTAEAVRAHRSASAASARLSGSFADSAALRLAGLAATKGSFTPAIAGIVAESLKNHAFQPNLLPATRISGSFADSAALRLAGLAISTETTLTNPENALAVNDDDLVSDFRFQQLLRWYQSLTEKQRRAFNDRFLALIVTTCCLMSAVSESRSLILIVDGMGVLLALMALCSTALDTTTDE